MPWHLPVRLPYSRLPRYLIGTPNSGLSLGDYRSQSIATGVRSGFRVFRDDRYPAAPAEGSRLFTM